MLTPHRSRLNSVWRLCAFDFAWPVSGCYSNYASIAIGLLASEFLALAPAYVAMPIANFISFEVINFVETFCGLGFLATCRPWAVIAMFGMKAVIHVAAEVFRAMKPRASADEDAARKPLRPVVAIRGTVIRRSVIVSVRTLGSDADLDTNLSCCFRSGCHDGATSKCCQCNKLESCHLHSFRS